MMRHCVLARAAVVVAALAVSLGSATPAAARTDVIYIELLPQVEASRSRLRLGDIARIDTADGSARAALEDLPICFAPVPGHTRQVTREYVQLKLAQERLDIAGVEFAGADVVHITSRTSTIPADSIRDTITEAIRTAMPWSEAETEISPPRILRSLTVTGNAPRLEVAFNPDEQFVGSVLARVRVYAGEELADVHAYRFQVALFRSVYHARAHISRGDIIELEHIMTERVDVGPLRGMFLTEPDLVVGQRARRSIRVGTRLTPLMVEAPPMISRGDRVRVNVGTDTYQISAVGKAQEAGAEGHVIRVKLPNRRRVYARVQAPGEVTLVR